MKCKSSHAVHVTCHYTSHVSQQLVLIDAIVKNGSSAAPETERTYTPPPGWRNMDEDIPSRRQQRSGTDEAPKDDKKSYTEEQRQGVLRFIHLASHAKVIRPYPVVFVGFRY